MNEPDSSLPKMLVVDDDREYLAALKRIFKRSDIPDYLELSFADGGKQALELMGNKSYRIILTDLKMPEVSGAQVLEAALKHNSDCFVLIMTAYADVKQAIHLISNGLYDYLPKPFEEDDLLLRLRKIIHRIRNEETIADLQNRLDRNSTGADELVFSSPSMHKLIQTIETVADTDFPVLISGESGTGKELVANLVHRLSGRKEQEYLKLNCAGIVPTLLESEMFGHEKGSFTGAINEKVGKFEQADGGTLFLDELGELAFDLQAKFLRLLQQGEFQRVGGNKTLKSDVRIIAATNRNLKEEIAAGRFREDLYFRLNLVEIHIPALRERKDDIPILSLHILEKLKQRYGYSSAGLHPDALSRLQNHDFPGNVRELENIISRAYVFSRDKEITPELLPGELLGANEEVIPGNPQAGPTNHDESPPAPVTPGPSMTVVPGPLSKDMDAYEKQLLLSALDYCRGNRVQAAEILDISRRTLYYKLSQHGIS